MTLPLYIRKRIQNQANEEAQRKEEAEKAAAELLESGVDLTDEVFTDSPDGSGYELALASLTQDLKQLKGKSREDKTSYKKQAIPRYMDFVKGYIESGQRYPNEVLVWLGIWLIDVDRIGEGIEFLNYAIDQQQLAPSRFSRTIEESLVELVSEWAQRQNKAGNSANPFIEQMAEGVHSGKYQVGEIIITSKCYRQASFNAEHEKELEKAIIWAERCMEANPKGGGMKTRIPTLKSRLKKQTEKPNQE